MPALALLLSTLWRTYEDTRLLITRFPHLFHDDLLRLMLRTLLLLRRQSSSRVGSAPVYRC
jgi:hypothetical protein